MAQRKEDKKLSDSGAKLSSVADLTVPPAIYRPKPRKLPEKPKPTQKEIEAGRASEAKKEAAFRANLAKKEAAKKKRRGARAIGRAGRRSMSLGDVERISRGGR